MRARAAYAGVVAAVLAALALAGSMDLGAQEEPLEVRLQHVAGVTPDAASAFFDALRRSVGRDDHRSACALIKYPLTHASGVVADAADCERRYDAIFTIPVRKAIGTQQFDDLFVNASGVMIGVGELWFAATCGTVPCQQPSDLHITAINSDASGLQPPKGKVLKSCFVSGQRIRVSADGQGGASLSVWRPARNTGAPDLEFPHADAAGPPAACGSRTWTFADGTRTYTVSDLPCDAYLSPPPMGSVGRVTLSTPTSPGVPLWCAEER